LVGLDPAGYGTHSLRRTKVACSIRRLVTFARANSSLVIRSWRARFGTSASKWTTLWSSQRRWNCEQGNGPVAAPRKLLTTPVSSWGVAYPGALQRQSEMGGKQAWRAPVS
jgi:hypothetical protein